MNAHDRDSHAHRIVAEMRRARVLGLAGGFATLLVTALTVGVWYAHLCETCRVPVQAALPTPVPPLPPLPPKALDRVAQEP